MRKKITAFILTIALLPALSQHNLAQDLNLGSPSLVVKQFYELLHAKQYVAGFRLSVYRPAIEGLPADDLHELEPEFERLATSLPAQVVVQGEQISGDLATVFVRLPNQAEVQNVTLIKIDGKWIIGDRETQKLIKKQGRDFFFNEKMRVSEAETREWLMEILGAELVYFQKFKRYTTLEELIQLKGVSGQLATGVMSGYQFTLQLGEGGKSFSVSAVPVKYGRTGRLSFYTDQTNEIRADDKGGKSLASSPPSARPTS